VLNSRIGSRFYAPSNLDTINVIKPQEFSQLFSAHIDDLVSIQF
jgi:hypothetical protein